jgi:hypothetical protein
MCPCIRRKVTTGSFHIVVIHQSLIIISSNVYHFITSCLPLLPQSILHQVSSINSKAEDIRTSHPTHSPSSLPSTVASISETLQSIVDQKSLSVHSPRSPLLA